MFAQNDDIRKLLVRHTSVPQPEGGPAEHPGGSCRILTASEPPAKRLGRARWLAVRPHPGQARPVTDSDGARRGNSLEIGTADE